MASHEQDQLYVVNPTETYYEVKWSGHPYGLQPGQKVIWPRFIAEHFAKYLATAILLKKEQAHKMAYLSEHKNLTDYRAPQYVNSKTERPPVVNSIITGVYTYFQQSNANQDPNAVIAQQIAQMNQEQSQGPKPLDIGSVDTNPAMGTLEDTDDEETEGTVPNGIPEPRVEQPVLPSAPTRKDPPTRDELIAEAKKLGLKPKTTMSNDEIRDMIKNY